MIAPASDLEAARLREGSVPEAALAIECVGLAKSYGSGAAAVQALRGVDLRLPAGELTMLVGPSGCGKTTLISVITGVLNATEGRCVVLGQDLENLRGRRRTAWRGRHVGFVFQQFNLLPSLTAAENVAVPLYLLGMGVRPALVRARAMLQRVGLEEKAEAFPRELSGGQQQRVAIARALVHEPRLVVCDEPTSALDHTAGQRVMSLFRSIALEADRAVLVVTHDARIFDQADRLVRLDDGRVVGIEQRSVIPQGSTVS